MSEAIRDQNHIPVMLGVSSTDSTTPIPVQIDPVTGRLLVDSTGGGGYTNLTQFVNQTAWRLFYSNGSGDVIELALGASGEVLTSAGASAIPTWTAVSGTGTVTSVSVVTANGVSGSVATATTTPAITLVLGAITPSAVQISGLTASELVATDASKNLVSLAVATYPSLTELTYLKGVTSAIQTQINAKANIASPTFTGTVTIPTPFTLGAVSVTSTGTQLNYLSSATGTTGTTSTNLVFSTSPTLVTPVLGVATATSINKVAITAPATNATLTIAEGKTLTVNSSITFTGTDSTTMTLPTTSKTIAANDGSNWTFTSQTIGDLVYASSTTAFTRLAAVALGSVLTSAGTGTAPVWNSAPQITTIELGHATDTTISRSSAGVIAVEGVVIPSISSTNTLTNKRVTKRTGTTTSSATPTINTDNVDYYSLTAQTVAITSFTTNLSGTPTLAQQLRIDVTGTAARAITWGASFANGPVALPTTTVTTTRLSVLLEWDGSIWRCMASGSTV